MLKKSYREKAFSNPIVREFQKVLKNHGIEKIRIIIPKDGEYIPTFLIREAKEKALEEFGEEATLEMLGDKRPMSESLLFSNVYQLFKEDISSLVKKYGLNNCSENDIRAIEIMLSENGLDIDVYLEPRTFENNEIYSLGDRNARRVRSIFRSR